MRVSKPERKYFFLLERKIIKLFKTMEVQSNTLIDLSFGTFGGAEEHSFEISLFLFYALIIRLLIFT